MVVTAEEIINIAREKSSRKAAEAVDVVTTGTFGPMCSSGAYFNIGHSKPRIKLGGGRVKIRGKEVPTGSLSSYLRAVEIAAVLKEQILSGEFLLIQAVAPLPWVESGAGFKPFRERPQGD